MTATRESTCVADRRDFLGVTPPTSVFSVPPWWILRGESMRGARTQNARHPHRGAAVRRSRNEYNLSARALLDFRRTREQCATPCKKTNGALSNLARAPRPNRPTRLAVGREVESPPAGKNGRPTPHDDRQRVFRCRIAGWFPRKHGADPVQLGYTPVILQRARRSASDAIGMPFAQVHGG